MKPQSPVTPQPAVVSALADWAAGVPTPAFGLVRHVLRPSVARLHSELRARVSYATKAGAHPLLLTELAGLVDEFNVTNIEHLDTLLLDVGVPAERICYLHPVLTPAILHAALDRGVRRFVIDDQRGLDLLLDTGESVTVTLRILPPEPGETGRSVVRFGNTADGLHELARKAVSGGLAIEAVSFFVGTARKGKVAATPFRRGIRALAELYRLLHADGIDVTTINIGGGFPGARRRFHLEHPGFFADIRAALDAEFDRDSTVMCEPGRYLAEPTLVLLTRVIADRYCAARRLVYLDAGAYSGLFEHSFIDPDAALPVWPDPAADGPWLPAHLLGPVIDSFDVIGAGVPLPPLSDGALVALPNVGAYAVGYSAPCEGQRPPEVIPLPDELSAALSEEWYP